MPCLYAEVCSSDGIDVKVILSFHKKSGVVFFKKGCISALEKLPTAVRLLRSFGCCEST